MGTLRSAFVVTLGALVVTGCLGAGSSARETHPIFPSAPPTLTDDQIAAEQSAGRAAFESGQRDWCAKLDISRVDLATLPRYVSDVDFVGAPSSFHDSLAEASLVVVGTVQSIAPGPNCSGTRIALSVERVLKGSAGQTLEFGQWSRFGADRNWTRLFIEDSEGVPLLLPGTRGEFLLDDRGTGPYVQERTGVYYFDAERVTTVELNPWKATYTGLTPDQMIEATLDAMK